MHMSAIAAMRRYVAYASVTTNAKNEETTKHIDTDLSDK